MSYFSCCKVRIVATSFERQQCPLSGPVVKVIFDVSFAYFILRACHLNQNWWPSRGCRGEDYFGGHYSMKSESLALGEVMTMTLTDNLDDDPRFDSRCVLDACVGS